MQQRDAPRGNFFLFALHAQELPRPLSNQMTYSDKRLPSFRKSGTITGNKITNMALTYWGTCILVIRAPSAMSALHNPDGCHRAQKSPAQITTEDSIGTSSFPLTHTMASLGMGKQSTCWTTTISSLGHLLLLWAVTSGSYRATSRMRQRVIRRPRRQHSFPALRTRGVLSGRVGKQTSELLIGAVITAVLLTNRPILQ